MSKNAALSYRFMEESDEGGQSGWSLGQAQRILYDFLLDIVNYWPPEDVLIEFRNLFIHHAESTNQQAIPALQVILLANHEDDFRSTIKRCCYILVNNWEISAMIEGFAAQRACF